MRYSIGDFSALTGLGIHTLRYYEKEHLITPARDSNNRRRYTEKDLSWALFLKRLKATNMPIKKIQRYAALRRAGDTTAAERMDLLLAHRQALEEQISTLQNHRDRLDEKIAFYRQLIQASQNAQNGTAP